MPVGIFFAKFSLPLQPPSVSSSCLLYMPCFQTNRLASSVCFSSPHPASSSSRHPIFARCPPPVPAPPTRLTRMTDILDMADMPRSSCTHCGHLWCNTEYKSLATVYMTSLTSDHGINESRAWTARMTSPLPHHTLAARAHIVSPRNHRECRHG